MRNERGSLWLPRFLPSLGWTRYYWGRLTLGLWPPACRLCRRPGGPLCGRCADFVPLFPLRCPACANPRLDARGCPECRRRPPLFVSVSALGAYRRGLRAAIHQLKFGGGWDLAFPLGERLAMAVRPGIDLLVPMPLHRERERLRGFNQAQLLTQVLSRAWHVPWQAGLQRVKATAPQALLPRRDRLGNVAGAFAAGGPVTGQRIGLVDDVFTTGATAQAAAGALLAAGAAAVHVIVLARAIPAPWERG